MKYSSSQIRSMSWQQWNETMANELNSAGFKARGYNPELHKWQDNYKEYDAGDEPKLFILGVVDGTREINHLKSVGLLNNGRCPMCGGPINGSPARFTSGFDSNMHFQICQSCCNHGKKTSVNPANNQGSGCMVALLMIPFQLIRSVFDMIFS